MAPQRSLAGAHDRNRDAAGPDLYRSPPRRWLRSALLASHQHEPVDLDAQRTAHGEIVAEGTAGYIATTSMQLNVVAQDAGATAIQKSNQLGILFRADRWINLRGRSGRSPVESFPQSIHTVARRISSEVQFGREAALLQMGFIGLP